MVSRKIIGDLQPNSQSVARVDRLAELFSCLTSAPSRPPKVPLASLASLWAAAEANVRTTKDTQIDTKY